MGEGLSVKKVMGTFQSAWLKNNVSLSAPFHTPGIVGNSSQVLSCPLLFIQMEWVRQLKRKEIGGAKDNLRSVCLTTALPQPAP